MYQEIILLDFGVDDVDCVICMCDINIVSNLSGNSMLWMCNGAVKTTPILFYQLYTIHAKVTATTLPVLLSSSYQNPSHIQKDDWHTSLGYAWSTA